MYDHKIYLDKLVLNALQDKRKEKQKISSTAGLEPATSCSGGKLAIHYNTRTCCCSEGFTIV